MTDAASTSAVGAEPERDLFGNTPKGRADWSHRRGEPRGLALAWTLYLMAASVIAFGPSAMVAADPTAYRPAAVRLVVLVSIGLFVLWPLLRFSQAWPRSAVRSFVVDAAVLLSPGMLLVWPHVLLAWWPVEVAAALTALLLGWTGMACGLMVGLACERAVEGAGDGRRGSLLRRVGGLTLWLGVVLAAPAAALALGFGGGLAADPGSSFGGAGWMVSPVSGVYEVARDRAWSGRPAQVSAEHWGSIGLVWVVAGVVWAWAFARRGMGGAVVAAGGAGGAGGADDGVRASE